jgi:hypothetical protein
MLAEVSSGECSVLLLYALVGPNSEDIARARPFPTKFEFCRVSGGFVCIEGNWGRVFVE